MSSMATQLALIYESRFPNAKQSVKERIIPDPSDGQFQVKVHSAAVNPVDWKIYVHGDFVSRFPTVLGTDIAGEITKVAPDVKNFKVGDRVFFQGQYNCQGDSSEGDKAGFQQYCIADAVLASKIPENIDYDSASTIPVGCVTAASALYLHGLEMTPPWRGGEGQYKGQKLVVLGGSSAVGCFAIQLAVLSGFEVITTSSQKHFSYLKSLGASAVVDRSAKNVVGEIIEAAKGEVPYVIDAVSLKETQEQGINILQPRGHLVLTLSMHTSTAFLARNKNIQVRGSHGASHMYPKFNIGYWLAAEEYLRRGVIKPMRPRVIPGGLLAWGKAFEELQKNLVSGEKLVLRPQETDLEAR